MPATWVAADYIVFEKYFELLLVTLEARTAIILRHHQLGWRDRLDCVWTFNHFNLSKQWHWIPRLQAAMHSIHLQWWMRGVHCIFAAATYKQWHVQANAKAVGPSMGLDFKTKQVLSSPSDTSSYFQWDDKVWALSLHLKTTNSCKPWMPPLRVEWDWTKWTV